jgi:DNA polymerase V
MSRISQKSDRTISLLRRITEGASVELPFFLSRVAAGFPSPADDYIDKGLDLNELLVRHPSATFFVRVSGDSMTGAGIRSGDILLVDRAERAADGSIIIAALDGELTVKRLRFRGDAVCLVPENDDYSPILVGPERQFEVWGVVVHVIHSLR